MHFFLSFFFLLNENTVISGHTETKKLSTISIHYRLHKNTYTIITLQNLQQYLQNTKMNVVRLPHKSNNLFLYYSGN